MLTYTPDHCAMRTDAFCTDYWWLRVMHLSIGRSVKVQMRPFVLPRSMDAAAAAGAMGSARAALATRQLATARRAVVALAPTSTMRGRAVAPSTWLSGDAGAPPPLVPSDDVHRCAATSRARDRATRRAAIPSIGCAARRTSTDARRDSLQLYRQV